MEPDPYDINQPDPNVKDSFQEWAREENISRYKSVCVNSKRRKTPPEKKVSFLERMKAFNPVRLKHSSKYVRSKKSNRKCAPRRSYNKDSGIDEDSPCIEDFDNLSDQEMKTPESSEKTKSPKKSKILQMFLDSGKMSQDQNRGNCYNRRKRYPTPGIKRMLSRAKRSAGKLEVKFVSRSPQIRNMSRRKKHKNINLEALDCTVGIEETSQTIIQESTICSEMQEMDAAADVQSHQFESLHSIVNCTTPHNSPTSVDFIKKSSQRRKSNRQLFVSPTLSQISKDWSSDEENISDFESRRQLCAESPSKLVTSENLQNRTMHGETCEISRYSGDEENQVTTIPETQYSTQVCYEEAERVEEYTDANKVEEYDIEEGGVIKDTYNEDRNEGNGIKEGKTEEERYDEDLMKTDKIGDDRIEEDNYGDVRIEEDHYGDVRIEEDKRDGDIIENNKNEEDTIEGKRVEETPENSPGTVDWIKKSSQSRLSSRFSKLGGFTKHDESLEGLFYQKEGDGRGDDRIEDDIFDGDRIEEDKLSDVKMEESGFEGDISEEDRFEDERPREEVITPENSPSTVDWIRKSSQSRLSSRFSKFGGDDADNDNAYV